MSSTNAETIADFNEQMRVKRTPFVLALSLRVGLHIMQTLLLYGCDTD